MKIQGRKSVSIGPGAPSSVPGQAQAEPVANVAGDTIEISTPGQVGKLSSTIAGLPDVRMEKIEDIRGAVEEGSYHVESEKLAKSVVDEALQDAIRRHRAGRQQA